MFIVVGLGNPGPQYKLTRHNVGFLVADALSQQFDLPFQIEKYKSQIAKGDLSLSDRNENVLLVKPQTYMNLSGEAVQPILTFYKIEKSNLIVVHDDVDIPFGSVRVHYNRGHGGQNGVRNIHEKIGPEYYRVKIGVGRSTNPQIGVADHVLQNFSSVELERLPEVLGEACDKILDIIEKRGIDGT